jgi:hypothetical protein
MDQPLLPPEMQVPGIAVEVLFIGPLEQRAWGGRVHQFL